MSEVTISKSTAELYKIRGVGKFEWADITLDHSGKQGRISISSSYGDWSHYWASCGCQFREFLIGLHIQYTAGKFGCGNCFDPKSTFEAWKEEIISYRKDESLSQEKARTLFDQVKEIESEAGDMEIVKSLLWNNDELLSWFDHSPIIHTCIEPSFQHFWNKIWPHFLSKLKEEISEEVPA